MTFEGYCFKSERFSWLIILLIIAGFVVFLGGVFGLSLLAPFPRVQGIAMAIWVALMAGALMLLMGPRRQQWGQGFLSDNHVIWESAETIHGEVVHRWHPSRVLIQGPRYFWLVLLAVIVVMAMAGHTPTVLTHNPADAAVVIVLALQSWITPVYRETLSIQTTAGQRRRIYVTKITSTDSGVSA
ncbi:hypothetical protein [Sulfobacillus harzensis]|uniref:Uncharacterized protein n=1 Tax=Sulfobacillus harzensis TaxID=2729629 RepID=A0A7Y0L7M9_9FIRM|nr:hypothetical protein [Sulfobacillus harzensis]NMP24251.1 hypothetical protein [Sulfobacillus harzensis]